MTKIVIHVVVFDPIKISIGLAHQNDLQKLSFVKVKYAYGKNMDRNGRKIATYYSASFPPRYCTVLLSPLRQYLLSALYTSF